MSREAKIKLESCSWRHQLVRFQHRRSVGRRLDNGRAAVRPPAPATPAAKETQLPQKAKCIEWVRRPHLPLKGPFDSNSLKQKQAFSLAD